MEYVDCYLKEYSEVLREFYESCDFLLTLDDGSQLPVHYRIITRCSPLMQETLAKSILADPSAASTRALPFSDCSREEATDFLTVIYALNPHKHITKESALSIARLGHKYGVKVHAQWPQAGTTC